MPWGPPPAADFFPSFPPFLPLSPLFLPPPPPLRLSPPFPSLPREEGGRRERGGHLHLPASRRRAPAAAPHRPGREGGVGVVVSPGRAPGRAQAERGRAGEGRRGWWGGGRLSRPAGKQTGRGAGGGGLRRAESGGAAAEARRGPAGPAPPLKPEPGPLPSQVSKQSERRDPTPPRVLRPPSMINSVRSGNRIKTPPPHTVSSPLSRPFPGARRAASVRGAPGGSPGPGGGGGKGRRRGPGAAGEGSAARWKGAAGAGKVFPALPRRGSHACVPGPGWVCWERGSGKGGEGGEDEAHGR